MRNFEVFCRQKLQPGCELEWQHSIDDLGTLHMNPVDRAGPFPKSRFTSKSFVKFSMCSYERAGWLGSRDLGKRAGNFAI